MILVDGHGNMTEVAVGMVDAKGCFVALLADSETEIRHLKFSSESGMIQQLSRDNSKLRKKLAATERKLERVQKDMEGYRQVAELRAERLEALQARVDKVNAAVRG